MRKVAEQIIKTEFSEVMQKSFIDYSMSVITARALPDARDGLKPVQRRVLYAMDQLGLNYDKPHRKSARIVGDTMGKYHPHGDSSIYETLVVLEQDFKKGMALVDGHGNFGSIEGDGAAAMRYTEAKLKKFTQDVYLKDLDKNVVDFVPNFDETEKEPEVLPVRVPNLLINGAEGIAVGMTTNIPTHNLAEVCDAVCAYMDNENITTEGLMQYVIGPDFPTGGLVVNKKDLLSIYESGTGKIKLRGKVEFEPGAKRTDKDKLVITEIPYTMIGANISKFISDVVDLIETKKTSDIVDISNESSKEGIRIVLELKKNADVEKLKNLLYKKTKLEDTFGVNMLAIVDNRPETLGLKAIIKHHVDFQYDIATRKYTTLLNKERENKEIKEGLIRACNIIDLIIEILRGSKNLKQAKECLINGDVSDIKFRSEASRKAAMKLDFTPRQATAVLELRLYKLIGLEIEALQKEYEETLNKIAEYEDVLNNRSTMKKVIKKDIQKIKKEYQVPRKTIIEDGKEAVYEEVKLVEQEVVFIMDRFGYAKTVDNNTFERNKEAIFNENKYVFKCMNTEKICIFTDKGDLHQVKVADIPFGRFRDKGTPIDNLGNYDSRGENIIYLCSTGQIIERKLLFATKMGMIKLVDGKEFDVTKRTVAATKLNDGDEVINVLPTDAVVSVDSQGQEIISSEEHLVIKTEGGYYLKFAISEIPQKKKGAVGVRGIKLVSGDSVSDLYLFNKESEIVVGYGKKQISLKDDINLTKRDGRGVKK
ncbi:DNA topoisomerase 4 subunit A [Falcatimonas sp. MSJ-15]|uniref:DNA gyrase/topoisomerase IV subunit A n=1 Tax=Falcatimonas sp. MSJ-15 TaxID=2841515 RepID=UPI001C11720F|nr:DNA topoisomerase 4 subunit A [Falcatimonas sp. MSJ-15]